MKSYRYGLSHSLNTLLVVNGKMRRKKSAKNPLIFRHPLSTEIYCFVYLIHIEFNVYGLIQFMVNSIRRDGNRVAAISIGVGV